MQSFQLPPCVVMIMVEEEANDDFGNGYGSWVTNKKKFQSQEPLILMYLNEKISRYHKKFYKMEVRNAIHK